MYYKLPEHLHLMVVGGQWSMHIHSSTLKEQASGDIWVPLVCNLFLIVCISICIYVTCVHCFFAIFLWLHIPNYLFQNMDICLPSPRICLKQMNIFPPKILYPLCRLAVPTHLCPNFTYLWSDQRIEHRCENVKIWWRKPHPQFSPCINSPLSYTF